MVAGVALQLQQAQLGPMWLYVAAVVAVVALALWRRPGWRKAAVYVLLGAGLAWGLTGWRATVSERKPT